MSKTISFRGTLPIGEQDRIRLKTNTGKTGYKITKFQIISTEPMAQASEAVAKITRTDQTGSISATVNFTDNDLLAVATYSETNSQNYPLTQIIIFDNQIVNQDMFVNITDAAGGTTAFNYYIELETMALSDLETTKLTLQSIRQLTE
jgi:hypothetical protein